LINPPHIPRLDLLRDIQRQSSLAILFITHDFGVVAQMCDRVAVMYAGKIVETAPTWRLFDAAVMYLGVIVEQATAEALFTSPLHPYTKALISAALPSRPGAHQERLILSGEVPSPTHPPSGCRFHTRCPFALAHCATEVPLLREFAPGHTVACHLY
jgi:oligopeptide/dipeptide ABC transporter ATP-binding protein